MYSAVKVRRLALAKTSGSGRGRAGATVLPAAALRSAAGKTVGEAEEIPLFFTLIPVLALLSNYDRENWLINVGTEGPTRPQATAGSVSSSSVCIRGSGIVLQLRAARNDSALVCSKELTRRS